MRKITLKFAETQLQRELSALHGIDELPLSDKKGGHYNPEVALRARGGEGANMDSSISTVGGKYLPPSMRGGDQSDGNNNNNNRRFGGRGEEDTITLRVTNISEDAQERDLHDLFKTFGQLNRVYLGKDRETGASRGFAYVTYQNREDAERAMNKLNGFGYDHLILKVEFAQSGGSSRDAGSENVMKYASGYGKALPQGWKIYLFIL